MKNYYEIDKCDLILASFSASDDSIPFEELEEIINANRLLLKDLDMDTYQKLAESYLITIEKNMLVEILFHLQNGIKQVLESDYTEITIIRGISVLKTQQYFLLV